MTTFPPLAALTALVRKEEPLAAPWSLVEKDGYTVIHSSDELIDLIATVYNTSGSEWSPAMRASARLIAAAPELLEALRAVVAVADRKTVEFDKAHAAIAKAEGK